MLPQRRILRVFGTDASSFVQGLFTNDVRLLDAKHCASKNIAAAPPALFGAFLTGNGRVVTDGIVFPAAGAVAASADLSRGAVHDGDLLIEADAAHSDKLVAALLAFKLRAQVGIEPVPHLGVRFRILQQQEQQRSNPGSAPASASFMDPRLGLLDTLEREITSISASPTDAAATSAPHLSVDEQRYWEHLLERGICEGRALWEHMRLPFEGNLDIIGGIHYDKGCYIGQELVQRAKTQLVSRKRLVPFTAAAGAAGAFAPGVELFRPATEAGGKKPQAVGKIVMSMPRVQNPAELVGVASVRLEVVDPERLEASLATSASAPVLVNVPFWWPDDEIDKCMPIATEQQQQQQSN
jgi:folate-binding protein YgfZ